MIGSVQEGRYRIVRKLGEGGQGEVYLVEHLHLERTEALKVLRAQNARDDNFVSRFRREARATNRVQHPNIVGVYDFGRLSDGRYFLAMEYVDGVRLDHAIGGAAMPVRRAVRIASQLARALAHAHRLGVVHRDLKPANLVLITHRGQVDFLKVLDFGMAKIVEADGDGDGAEGLGRTLAGQMFGTGPYMAPEQFLERGADPRMDVYATGCILHEMLTGVPPFTGGMVALMGHHLRTPVTPPSRRAPAAGIPSALDDLVLRALAKRPDDRFADAGTLADALDSIGADAPTDRGGRRTRTGVVVPQPIDDFGGDTENTDHITETGDEPSVVSAASTERMPPAHAIEIASALLAEIGEALLDGGTTEMMLVAQMAQLRDLRSQLARIRGEAREVEARGDALEQSFREREASLSFAIGELTFDRDQADPQSADVGVQIEQLEHSLATLHAASKQQLAVLDDQALGLAAILHDAEEAHQATCRRLAQVIAAVLDRQGEQPEAIRLRPRMATVQALFEVT